MPRAKLPKKVPIETFTFDHDGETVTAEVWNNRADIGTRGMHKIKLRDDAFNAALEAVERNLNDPSPTLKGRFERLVDGRLKRSEFGRTIVQIAKAKGLEIGQTLSEEIADDIRKHYLACKNALDTLAVEKKINPGS